MTNPVPIITAGINDPSPDAGHERLRRAIVDALNAVWEQHMALVDELATARADIDALTDRVAGLEALVSPNPLGG